MPNAKKIARVAEGCVACGTCVTSCPVGAISIYMGMRAVVKEDKCIGCGKCVKVCPSDVMEMTPTH